MSIGENLKKIKNFFQEKESREKALTIAIIFLVGTASFGLGRLSYLEDKKEPVKIEQIPLEARVLSGVEQKSSEESLGSSGPLASDNVPETLPAGGEVVASKNGGKYHFPWCSGAKRILEENKVYFNSTLEARTAGYTPAANCKGLK